MIIPQLLQVTITHKASDLHLSAGLSPRLRIDGELIVLSEPVFDQETLKNVLFSIMTAEQQAEFNTELDVDFAYTFDNQSRFRVNVFQQQRGISAAFRLIPSHIPTLQQLDLPSALITLCQEKQGLILITGATGSGKSTTLAALLHHINLNQAKHIITIEDPVEYVHNCQQSLISQREVKRDIKTFHQALRAALREDPDIICIAELRDLETIRLALTAAETGHLVLATLHTVSAAKALDRIVDVFPGSEKEIIRTQLSESLTAVIAQRLLRQPQGGRLAEFEILLATSAIRNLIREHKTAQIYSSMQAGQGVGMRVFGR